MLAFHRGNGAISLRQWFLPAPTFLFVSRKLLSAVRVKEAMPMGVLGITCGDGGAGVALLGLHLIIEKWPRWYTIIMAVAAARTCAGGQMPRGALKNRMRRRLLRITGTGRRAGRSFQRALPTNLSNPKAIIHYFGSVFHCLSAITRRRCGALGWYFALITPETLARLTVVASLFALPKMRRIISVWRNGLMVLPAPVCGACIHLIISRSTYPAG